MQSTKPALTKSRKTRSTTAATQFGQRESTGMCLSFQVADIDRLDIYLNWRGVVHHYNDG